MMATPRCDWRVSTPPCFAIHPLVLLVYNPPLQGINHMVYTNIPDIRVILAHQNIQIAYVIIYRMRVSIIDRLSRCVYLFLLHNCIAAVTGEIRASHSIGGRLVVP